MSRLKVKEASDSASLKASPAKALAFKQEQRGARNLIREHFRRRPQVDNVRFAPELRRDSASELELSPKFTAQDAYISVAAWPRPSGDD